MIQTVHPDMLHLGISAVSKGGVAASHKVDARVQSTYGAGPSMFSTEQHIQGRMHKTGHLS